MNRKVIIQIVIIVGCFAAAGFVLYNGFHKDSGSVSGQDLSIGQNIGMSSGKMTVSGQGASKSSSSKLPAGILPFGNTLDFSVLKQQTFYFNQVDYPKLGSVDDVGIPEDALIVPVSAK